MQNKTDVIIVNIWLIQWYHIFIKKFNSLSSLALIHKSIRLTTISAITSRTLSSSDLSLKCLCIKILRLDFISKS